MTAPDGLPRSSVMDRIASHFRSDELRMIEVQEWGADGSALVIKFRPVTIDDLSRMQRVSGSGIGVNGSAPASASSWERAIWLICRKARAEDGETYLFGPGDEKILRDIADPDVVLRTAARILGSGSAETTPTGTPTPAEGVLAE